MLVAEQLSRITGSKEEDLSKALRLDRFAGTQQLELLAQEFGIETFLTADDEERKSYCLSDSEREVLNHQDYYEYEDILFTPTDIRVEELKSLGELENALNNHKDEKYLVIFIHEYKLNYKTKQMINRIGAYGVEGKYTFTNKICKMVKQ